MAVRDIITDLEELGIRSEELDVRKENDIMRQIILDLKDTIRSNNLTSLSAPQIGSFKRIVVINFNGDLRTFINPIITEVRGFELRKEKCSSIPEKNFVRPRHNQVGVTYTTPLGKIESRMFSGLAATIMQHCIDHLDGLLLSDVGMEIDEEFEKASEEERAEVIKMYLESLDIKQKEVKKEIEEDPELQKIAKAADFIEKVQKGEVKLGKTVTKTVKNKDIKETSN